MRVEGDQSGARRFALKRPDWTVPDDPRRTPIGAFLRRFSLDEFPQFYNVLVGEMSIVGPRPIATDEASLYGELSTYCSLKPGLTGPWQVGGRNQIGFAQNPQSAQRDVLQVADGSGYDVEGHVDSATLRDSGPGWNPAASTIDPVSHQQDVRLPSLGFF